MTTQDPLHQELKPAGTPLHAQKAVDPLAQITLRPRAFFAGIAVLAMLIGLLLAILPIRVASADPARTAVVSCGSVLGGVESGRVRDQSTDELALVTHLDMCDRSVTVRGSTSAVLFIGGLLGGLWLGIVRRPD
jgi:hypothetical protein